MGAGEARQGKARKRAGAALLQREMNRALRCESCERCQHTDDAPVCVLSVVSRRCSLSRPESARRWL